MQRFPPALRLLPRWVRGILRGAIILCLLASGQAALFARTVHATPAAGDSGGQGCPLPADALEGLGGAAKASMRAREQALEAALADPSRSSAEEAAAWGSLAQAYHAFQLYEGAAACYRKAAQGAPGDYRWPYFTGLLAYDTGQLEKARSSFSRVVELRPDDLPSVLRLAQVHLDLGELMEAQRLFERALALDPESAAAHYGLGRVALLEGEPAEAVEHLEAVLAAQPEASSVHYPLAMAYRSLGRLDEAREHAASRGAGGVSFTEPLAEELRGKAGSAHFHVALADQALLAGKLDVAVEGYRKALRADPESPQAHQGMGQALEKKGDLEGAENHFRKAWALDSSNPYYAYYLGRIRMLRSDPREAGELLREALRLDPSFDEAHVRLAEILESVGRPDEALQHYDRLLTLQPESRSARLRRAQLLRGMGRVEDAKAGLEELLRLDPRDAEARVSLATLLMEQGESAPAEAELQAVLDSGAQPDVTAIARYNLGVLRARRGDDPGAIDEYRAALALDPDLDEAQLQLAGALGRQGRYGEAAAEYQTLLERDPEAIGVRLGLTTARVLAGEHDAARAVLEDGLRLQPQDPHLAHSLARLLATLPGAAPEDRERSLELALDAFVAARTLERGETVAMAYAAAGEQAEAVEWQEHLIEEAENLGDARYLARLRVNLERYRQGQAALPPWVEE